MQASWFHSALPGDAFLQLDTGLPGFDRSRRQTDNSDFAQHKTLQCAPWLPY